MKINITVVAVRLLEGPVTAKILSSRKGTEKDIMMR
jgi:hypothetical protein